MSGSASLPALSPEPCYLVIREGDKGFSEAGFLLWQLCELEGEGEAVSGFLAWSQGCYLGSLCCGDLDSEIRSNPGKGLVDSILLPATELTSLSPGPLLPVPLATKAMQVSRAGTPLAYW